MDEYSENNEKLSITLPPHSIDAEQSLLGGLMLDNQSWDDVADVISVDDFYRLEHRSIYEAIKNLIEQRKNADVVTVQEELIRLEKLDSIGGFAYLASLPANIPSAFNVRDYAEIIRSHSIRRRLIETSADISKSAYTPFGKSAENLLDEAEQKIFRIAESSQKSNQGLREAKPIVKEVLEHIQELFNTKDNVGITGIATGFKDLDRLTAGFQRGDLIVIAGRPSMGKTAFAMNIAENMSIHHNKAVAIFSMEMSASQLITRMLASIAGVNQSKLKTAQLVKEDMVNLSYAHEKLASAPIYIDETPALNPLEIRARARRLARKYENQLGMIVIDYLQLMSGSSQSDNRSMELGVITRSLKALARELNVPVIVLSQLSREVEKRTNRRPIMSDLRESGAIEQDADLIIFMYREFYYKEKENPDDPMLNEIKNKAEAIIGKHRNGATGTIELSFEGEYARFRSTDHLHSMN